VFTIGIVSIGEGYRIGLYFTGRKPAGENLAGVLKQRAAGLEAPIQMCDALWRNLPKLPEKPEIIVGHSMAHARRHFVEVTPNCPRVCRFVGESLSGLPLSSTIEEWYLTPAWATRYLTYSNTGTD